MLISPCEQLYWMPGVLCRGGLVLCVDNGNVRCRSSHSCTAAHPRLAEQWGCCFLWAGLQVSNTRSERFWCQVIVIPYHLLKFPTAKRWICYRKWRWVSSSDNVWYRRFLQPVVKESEDDFGFKVKEANWKGAHRVLLFAPCMWGMNVTEIPTKLKPVLLQKQGLKVCFAFKGNSLKQAAPI